MTGDPIPAQRPPAVPLYRHQRRWLADRSRFKIGMWSRQIGKTFTASLEIVLDVMEARATGRRSPWLILSRGDRQAREAMRAGVQAHARACGIALRTHEREIDADGETFRAHEWDAGGGNVITALPANPDTARGYSRNVWLDEFALHRDSREIWAALYPTVTRGWRLRVTSTPNGRRGKFHELMTARGADASRWSRHIVTIHDAVGDGYPADPAELRAGLGDDALWRQEYECEWLDEASAWLSWEMIHDAGHDAAGDAAAYGGGPAFVGVDIARRRDLWVAWALEMVGDVAWTREIRAMRGAAFAVQEAALDAMVARYRPVRVAMDRTGIGEMPVERAQRRYGVARVDGVAFSAARKLDLATALRERFEARTIRIPRDRAVAADLHAVRKTVGPTGAMRLVADGESDGHADRFWAGALACASAAARRPAPAGASVGGDLHRIYAPRTGGPGSRRRWTAP